MKHEVYLALGSNMGDQKANLRRAIDGISNIKDTDIIKMSHVYHTEPVGYLEQKNFLNMALLVHTDLEPYDLLVETQKVENALKRERNIRWGPRTIDIDILTCDEIALETLILTLPHPRMFERAFVLVPFRDVYPYTSYRGINIEGALQKCSDKNGVEYYCESLELGK